MSAAGGIYKEVQMKILCLLLAFSATAAFAKTPPQQKTQPGYYRMMVGDIEVTPLFDAYFDFPKEVLVGDAKEIDKLLDKAFVPHTGPTLRFTDSAFLIHNGTKLVLVDTGAGKLFGPTGGKLIASLKEAGYSPDQIDVVVITHMHGDHVGGLEDEKGRRAFKNADLRIANEELAYWDGKEPLESFPEGMRNFVKMARESVAPYKADGKLKPIMGEEEIVPGVFAKSTNGHTPGHTSFVVKSKGEELVVLGDIIHNAALQFANPKIAMKFDVIGKKAIPMREKLFAEFAKSKTWIAGEHLPFPGIGHIRAEGKGYVYVPINYLPIQ
jgi:glyoxylase-like metal-dependent hydrolase (beta-lactamase superfamily II)